MYILKRNKQSQVFNPEKIEKALEKCFRSVGKKDAREAAKKYTDLVVEEIDSYKNTALWSVEKIQDRVEKLLLNASEFPAYEEYSRYRKEREIIRNLKLGVAFVVKIASSISS